MIGKIAWWTAPSTENINSRNRGYGFIEITHEHGILEKFFVLGSRLLFEGRPTRGMLVEFDISPELPRRANGYKLAENVRPVVAESEPKAAL